MRGELIVQLGRRGNQPPRQATLAISYQEVRIYQPRHLLKEASLQLVAIQGIPAEEENPPQGETPVSCLLITPLPVTTFPQAVQLVKGYSYRWLIEQYHFVLKSGCRIEELPLEEAERIERALATYCIVAWRLLWLTYEARENPDAPGDRVLETQEWEALYGTIHKSPLVPAEPPKLREAVRWIAQLGGFLGRKGDGEPGVKTIWQGMRRWQDIAATGELLKTG